jgi:hypothetical protein
LTGQTMITESYPDEEFLFFDGLDDAIMGVVDGVVCYGINESIAALQKTHEWDEETSSEWFWFNVHGAYLGKKTPVFIDTLEL